MKIQTLKDINILADKIVCVGIDLPDNVKICIELDNDSFNNINSECRLFSMKNDLVNYNEFTLLTSLGIKFKITKK